MGLKAPEIPFPIQSEAQRRVEDGWGIEGKLGAAGSYIVLMGAGAIAVDVMARQAALRFVLGQADIFKQALAKGKLHWIGIRRRRNGRDWLLICERKAGQPIVRSLGESRGAQKLDGKANQRSPQMQWPLLTGKEGAGIAHSQPPRHPQIT
jgi:hypothetical protein